MTWRSGVNVAGLVALSGRSITPTSDRRSDQSDFLPLPVNTPSCVASPTPPI